MSVKIAYVVTKTSNKNDAICLGHPIVGVEVFVSYINALRYLAEQKKVIQYPDCTYRHHFPKHKNKYYHEILGVLYIYRKGFTDRYVITRVPIMDK